VADSCEEGDEPSGSIKDGEFLDQESDCRLSKGFCSTELIFSHSL
jgi:hypothetical protein